MAGEPRLGEPRPEENLTQEKLPITTDTSVSPLRQRMIEDMAHASWEPHLYLQALAAFLKRFPDTATTEDTHRFQIHLAKSGISICIAL